MVMPSDGSIREELLKQAREIDQAKERIRRKLKWLSNDAGVPYHIPVSGAGHWTYYGQEADASPIKIGSGTVDNIVQHKTDLRGADLSEAPLRGADLSKADLAGAMLSSADLEGANLTEANLVSAHLSYANLENASLSRANLQGAYLREANLRGANVTDEQLADTLSLQDATMPDGQGYEDWLKDKAGGGKDVENE